MRTIDPRLLRRGRPVRGCLAVLVLLGVLDAVLLAGQATELANLVCAVVSAAPPAANSSGVHALIPSAGRRLPHVRVGIGAAVAILLAASGGRAAVSWARELIAARTATIVKSALRADLLAGLVRGPVRAADRTNTGELSVLATRGIDALDGYFGRYLPQLTLAALVPLLLGVRILTADPLSALVVALTIPLVPVFVVLIGLLTRDYLAARWISLDRLGGHFLEALAGLPTLVAFGRARRQTMVIRRAAEAHRKMTIRTLRVAFLSSLALELIAFVSMALVAVGIGLRLAAGTLDLRTGLLVLICAPEVYLPLRQLGARYHEASEGLAAADRIFAETAGGVNGVRPPARAETADQRIESADTGPLPTHLLPLPAQVSAPVIMTHAEGESLPESVLESELELAHVPAQPHTLPVRASSKSVVMAKADAADAADAGADFANFADTEIRFEHIRLNRVGRPGPTLDDFCLRLAPGRITGVVGPSGTGKSTLIRLLLGFDQPSTGRVTIGGTDLADLAPGRVRAQIAWVPQHPQLTGSTVGAAIRLGDPDATEGDLIHAAAAAGLDLPLETPLGRNGSAISGGQARRVALARAILRDAPIVLLDEPTEHLDPESEQIITEALRAWLPGRTVLLVTHQPALFDLCDSIMLLDHVSAHPNADAQRSAAEPSRVPGRRPRPGSALEAAAAGRSSITRQVPAGLTAAWKSTLGESGDEIQDVGSNPGPAKKAKAKANAKAMARHKAKARRASTTRSTTAARVRLHLLGAVGLGAAAALCGVGLMAASAWLIATAALRPPLVTLQVGIAAVQVFGLGRAALRYAERLAAHDATLRLVARLRVRVYRGLVRRSPAGLAAERGGDLLTTVTADIEATQDLFLQALLPMSGAALACLAVLTAEFLILPVAALVLGAGIGVAGVLVPAAARRTSRAADRRTSTARAALADHTANLLDALPDLIAFGGVGSYAARVARADRRLSALERRGALGAGLGGAVVIAVIGFTSAALALCALDATRTGRLTGPVGAALVLAPTALFELLAVGPDAARAFDRGRAARRRLARLAGAPPLVPRPAVPFPLRWAADSELEFERVSARWPGGRQAAVRDLSFRLRAGLQLSLSGPRGAGKSTAAHLATRGLDPFSGAVRLNGTDLREADPDDVRRLIAVVSQDAHLFDATIRENLLIGRPGAAEEQLWAALETVCLADWVRSLPDGLDTWVGRLGDAVSDSERRRIALARALLSPAPVLILDEPTAHLDAATAALLDENLRRELRGRTVLWIRHDATLMPPIRAPRTDLHRQPSRV